MSHTERIQQLLQQRPGLKAQQIANELGLERSFVAAELHRLAAGEVFQDSAYRWWPKSRAVMEPARPAQRSFLAQLCRYYLECLARESGSGISIPAAARDSEYVALDELPLGEAGGIRLGPDRAMRKIIRKASQERGQLTLYVGYAVRLRM